MKPLINALPAAYRATAIEAGKARLAVIEPASDWPKPDPTTGELLDARGIAWIEAAHSANKTCNADGSWRRKRGVDHELIESLEAAALAKAAPEPAEAAPPSDPEPTTSEFERIRYGIETAPDQQAIDEWTDYSREVVITQSQRLALDHVATIRQQELANAA